MLAFTSKTMKLKMFRRRLKDLLVVEDHMNVKSKIKFVIEFIFYKIKRQIDIRH